jgi:hypothetical protein
MTDRFIWVDTTGGPHILMPLEQSSTWRGTKGSTDLGPDDLSDYAAACRVGKKFLGKVRSGAGHEVVVLSGDVGPVAWFAGPGGEAGVLVQWLGCDSEEAVLALLKVWHSDPLNELLYEEVLEFETGSSGSMQLFDAAESSDQRSVTGTTIRLPFGRYKIRAAYVETANCIVVLRAVAPTCGA